MTQPPGYQPPVPNPNAASTPPPGGMPPAGHPWPTNPQPGGYGPIGAPTYVPPQRPKGRKGPTILLVSGLAMCVLAGVILAMGIAGLFRLGDSLSPLPSDGSTPALQAGVDYGLYSENIRATCTVFGPDGAQVMFRAQFGSVNVNDRELIASFTPSVDGVHTVRCDAAEVWLGPSIGVDEVFRVTLLMLAGLFGLSGGVPVALGGLIWLIVRISSDKKLAQG